MINSRRPGMEQSLVQVAMSSATEQAMKDGRCDLVKLANGHMLFVGQYCACVHEVVLWPPSCQSSWQIQTSAIRVPRAGCKVVSLVALLEQRVPATSNAPGNVNAACAEAEGCTASARGGGKGGASLFMQDIAIALADGTLAIMSYVCDRSAGESFSSSNVPGEAAGSNLKASRAFLVPKRLFSADTESVPTNFYPQMLIFDQRPGLLLALSKTQATHTIESFKCYTTTNQNVEYVFKLHHFYT